MNLYLDDDSAKAQLVALLRKARHRVLIPADAAMAGSSDARHFEYAPSNWSTVKQPASPLSHGIFQEGIWRTIVC